MKKSVINFKFNKQFLKLFLFLFIAFITILLFYNPKLYISSVFNGLSVWALSVLPSLFPFFIITKSITALNIISYNNKIFKMFSKLFKVPICGVYIFFMSIMSGSPVGAKLIAEFYNAKIINEKQASKLVCISSTSSPLFILGTVGTMMLSSVKIGFILLISHIFSVVLNGIIFRKAITNDTLFNDFKLPNSTQANVLYDIMMNSILSVLLVGGYIAIFYMIIQMLNNSNILSPIEYVLNHFLKIFNLNGTAKSILNGLIEVTNGCKSISLSNILLIKKAVIASLLIGFGGMCIHMQCITFLINAKVNIKFYFLSKTIQAITSSIITFILMLFFH